MKVIVCTFQGRFGNACMQYLFCRAAAEQLGAELQTDPWIGERVFDISHPRPEPRERHRFNETDAQQIDTFSKILNGHLQEAEFRGYAQMQGCMIYTKRQAQAWLKLRPEIEEVCKPALGERPIVCHIRRGDYAGYSYPLVSEQSYNHAIEMFGLRQQRAITLSDDYPTLLGGLPDDLSFMFDFYRMMKAPTLLRANSSFSWLAALLGNGLVLSPVVEGLEGGKEHDCRFVAGNWPRFTNLDFVTDLHVTP